MIKKFCIFIFTFITFCVSLHCQSSLIEGKVVDQDGQPLYLALVYNADLSIGTYTNEQGQFLLETEEKDFELEVFALGYLRKKIYPGGSPDPMKVAMKKLVYDLDELVITPCGDKVKAWGVDPESSISAVVNSPIEFSSQKGLSIPVPPDQQIIEIEVMALNRRIQRGNFRLRIYSLDSMGLPSEELLHQNLIVRLPRLRSKRPISIDMEEYNVFTSDYGILVAVEVLSLSQNLYRVHSGNDASGYYAPKIGLVAIEKYEDLQMWSKRDEDEWSRSNPPVYGSETQRQVPYIRVYLSNCP
ncbi:MAG: hypothetical protein EA411_13060 [Saprospirales bacterium]|nr:MAG: hypothetical protein EA411_13060 [Saprospirales bacterium]